MARKAKAGNPNGRQVARAATIAAPTGGWDAQSPLAQMPITNAVILDNWIPRSGFCEIRRGFAPQVTGTPAAVETLMTYRGGASGDTLFAASNGKLYDVTTFGGALGAAVYSGATSNRWNYTAFANGAGNWLIAVNGVDTPIGYNAGAWATLPAITGSSGSITLTSTNLLAVAPHQGRLLFIEKNTLHVWFPAAAAVGGAMQLLDLGSVFSKGGRLIAVDSWSWQLSVSADQFAVFLTDQGQVALYTGIDPSLATDWTLVGVFDFGTPIGQRALVKYGGDLAVIATDGIVPLSKAIKLDRSEDDIVALTAKIGPAFASSVRAYQGNYGWQGILYSGATVSNDVTASSGSLAIFNIPTQTLSTSIQYVQNMATGAWASFSGLNAFCWETANQKIYFGSSLGVYQWDYGASDDGLNITATVLGAFNSYGGAQTKKATMVRPLLETSSIVKPALDVNADYDRTIPTSVPTVVSAGNTDTSIRYDWTGASGIGYVLAPTMSVTIGSDPAQSVLLADTGGDTMGVTSTNILAISSGLPYDVPCQLIAFDLMFEVGGQL